MKTMRKSSSGARELLRLGKLLDDPVALELREIIDEQHAVQMVDLVLNAGGENAGAVHFLGFAGAIEKPDFYFLRATHHVEEFRNRQAAFLIIGLLLARPGDFGVNEENRLLFFTFLGEIDHHEALRDADLD